MKLVLSPPYRLDYFGRPTREKDSLDLPDNLSDATVTPFLHDTRSEEEITKDIHARYCEYKDLDGIIVFYGRSATNSRFISTDTILNSVVTITRQNDTNTVRVSIDCHTFTVSTLCFDLIYAPKFKEIIGDKYTEQQFSQESQKMQNEVLDQAPAADDINKSLMEFSTEGLPKEVAGPLAELTKAVLTEEDESIDASLRLEASKKRQEIVAELGKATTDLQDAMKDPKVLAYLAKLKKYQARQEEIKRASKQRHAKKKLAKQQNRNKRK